MLINVITKDKFDHAWCEFSPLQVTTTSIYDLFYFILQYTCISGLPQCNLFLFGTKGHSRQLLRLYRTDVNGWMRKDEEESRHGLF